MSSQNSSSGNERRAHGSFRVGLVQMRMSPDPRENLAKAVAKVTEAARAGAEVICLPEMYRSLYFCQTEDHAHFGLAEPLDGESAQAFAKVSRDHKVAVVVPIFERRAPGLYHNSAVILGRTGDVAGVYRKMHIPDDPCFYEKFYFTPGDLGFRAMDVGFGRIGTLICWDQWYPEGARITALAGASVLFYPTAIGWHPAEKAKYGAGQRDAWKTIQRSHAIANGVYVAAVNRVGHEAGPPGGAGLEFWGTSFLCDPWGAIIAEASVDQEETLIGEIDIARQDEIRTHWPFLRDRRIDAYGPIQKRFLDDTTP